MLHTCHLKSMDGKFSNIKIVCHPKHTTRLQPLHAGIIINFKVKYQKSLVKYVLFQFNGKAFVADIIADVSISMDVQWVQRAWKGVSPSTVK